MNKQSLRLHLTITFAIMAMIPILVLGTIQVLQIRNITNDYNKTQSQTTYRLADAVQTYTYYHRNAVETLATTISASGPAFRTRESMTSKLQSVKDNLPGFSSLFVTNANGVVTAHYPEQGASHLQPLFGMNMSSSDYFIKVKATEATTISSLFRGPESGNEPTIVIAAPLYTDQKQLAGIAVGVLDLQQIKLLVTKYDYGYDAYPVVLDPTGRAIYHPDREITSSLADLSTEPVVKDAQATEQGSGKYHSNISKQSELITYTTIKDLGWTVWVGRSYTSVNAALSDSMQTTLILLAFTLVITVIVGNLLAKRFNNTIHLLVGYTRKLADGVFGEPQRDMTPAWGVPYELDMLANHFFRMAEQIKENQRALIELNAQLENRVTERTQSLLRKNQELEIVNVLLTPTMPNQETNGMIDESMRQLHDLIGVEIRLRLYPYSQTSQNHEEPAAAVIPVTSGNSPLGELVVFSGGGAPIPEHDRKFLLTFSNTIAVIIQNDILVSRLRHEYASLNAVLESMSDAIVLIGIQQNVVYANRRMTEMFAIPTQELLDMTEEGLFGEISVKLSDCHEEWTHLTTKQRTQATLKIRDDNGKERFILVSAFQAAGDERIFGRGYVWRDITKEHEIDALKNDLISLASHEFKTPITSIRGGVETLLRTDAEWEESFKRELLEGIHEDIGRIQNLIDEWLDISKIDAGAMRLNRQPLRVGAVIDNAIHRLPQQADFANTEFDIRLSSDIPLIYADKLRMEQVLVNLFTNAIQYNDNKKPFLRIMAEADEAAVHIHIQDNGIGMAEEHLDHIFDRFYRVDVSSSRQTGGTGLGLAICKGIMEAHGGRVQVRSTPGTGSTFIISIPVFNAKEGEDDEEA
ncbi:ATP-binding protein [Paenibacillus foliorum]|uniref:ATP-binding protein n=1 Tax=Paenibacillus foliorum TaxID=2654974 RepID=UPI001491C78E|nr:ATP-binding protein [Paenibacillus foliorum]